MRADLVRAEVGFIGLEKMGGAIAGRLVSQGIPLHVYDTRSAAVEELRARGAQACRDAAEVASRCETTCSSVCRHRKSYTTWQCRPRARCAGRFAS